MASKTRTASTSGVDSSSVGSGGGGLRITRWVLVLVGAISAFLGVFILIGGEDQYIGLGGDASWRVGDIPLGWGWGLLIAGALFLAAGLMVFIGRRGQARAVGGRAARTDLIAHAVIFVLVNTFVWAQDIALGDGVNYAWWLTIPWGIGLGAHAISYATSRR